MLSVQLPKLLLVDDHKMVATGLARLLATRYAVTVAATLAQMQTCLAQQTFDLALLDLQMSDGHSYQDYRNVLQAHKLPILIVAATISDAQLHQCYRDGVRGYVPKNLSEEELTDVVASVLLRGNYWRATEQQRLRDFNLHKPEVPKRFQPVLRHLLAPTIPESQEIADAENLSLRTVNNYISTLLQIYQVGDRHQLSKKLTQMGYTQDFLPD